MWCAARHCAFESHPLRQKHPQKRVLFFFSVTHGINFHGKRRLHVYEFFYGFLAFQQLMYYNKKIDTADGHKPETPL